MTTHTLVVMALKDESQGEFEKAGVSVFYTSVGSVKATFALTQQIHKLKPNCVINLGTAGSYKFRQGDLVECTSFIQRSPHDFLPLKSKKITTTPVTDLHQVICGSADFIEQNNPTVQNCDIFDMEAYALAYVCEQMNVKFQSIKYISDHSNENTIQDWKSHLQKASKVLLEQFLKIQNQIN